MIGRAWRYDRACCALSADTVAAYERDGRPRAIRFVNGFGARLAVRVALAGIVIDAVDARTSRAGSPSDLVPALASKALVVRPGILRALIQQPEYQKGAIQKGDHVASKL